MLNIKGEKTCTISTTTYEALYTHDRGSETVIIKDPLVNTQLVADERAKSELIKGGYSERWVTITSVHTPNLKQNDIISFKGVNWIVKEISLSFTPPSLTQTIRGVRYE